MCAGDVGPTMIVRIKTEHACTQSTYDAASRGGDGGGGRSVDGDKQNTHTHTLTPIAGKYIYLKHVAAGKVHCNLVNYSPYTRCWLSN